MSRGRRRKAEARARRAARRRLGSAIVFALTVLTPIMLASGTVLSQLRSFAEEVDHRIHSVTTQLVAASGAHVALAQLATDLSFRGPLEVELNGGRSTVEITQIRGEDTPTDVTDDIVRVRSEGWLNGPSDGETLPGTGVRWYRSVVNTTVRPRVIHFPIDQSLFIGDATPQVLLNGTQFRIAGEDSSGDPKPEVPGIGVTGDPNAVAAQIPPMVQPLITGSDGPTPASIVQTPMVDLTGWIDRFHVNPGILWETTNETIDSCELGTDDEPTVAFAEGGLTIRGNVIGRGVLVVQGDLTVTGSLDYAGIILVGGSASFHGSMLSRTRQRGAFMLGGSDAHRDLEIFGDVQIRYDSSAVEQFAGQYVDSIEVVTWDHDLDAGAPGTGAEAANYR